MKRKIVDRAYLIAYIIFVTSMVAVILFKHNYQNELAAVAAMAVMCMSAGVMVGILISIMSSAKEIIKHLKSLQK